jgi:hypothetical protein
VLELMLVIGLGLGFGFGMIEISMGVVLENIKERKKVNPSNLFH